MSKRELRKRLKEARALIADPKHWTKRQLARTATGHKTTPTISEAVRWCAIGACEKVSLEFAPLVNALRACNEGVTPVTVNDNTQLPRGQVHRNVLALFDCAIEKAK